MVVEVKVNPEYQVLCPPLTSEKYESLRESIRSEGLWVPLVINTDYEILDGNHRHRACEEVGRPWDDPKPIMKRFRSKLLEKKFVIETNLKRRQLTTHEQKQFKRLRSDLNSASKSWRVRSRKSRASI